MLSGNEPLGQALAIAEALTGKAVEVRPVISSGRNSRIYRVECEGRAYALKQYPARQDDPRDRLTTEVGALQLMERYGFKTVPQVVGVDRQRGYALLSWIDGTQIGEVTNDDIDAAVSFLAAIHALRHAPAAAEQPAAAEACLSGTEIERQLSERLARLQAVSQSEPELADFLQNTLNPARQRLLAKAKDEMAAAGIDFAAELPQERRTLVPSDFGFHNSLRCSDGGLAFVDFEYFGWDDPVKLTADILLHPGRDLPGPQRRRFRQSAIRLYGEDPTFVARLRALMPLFGVRWTLILLNEFIPQRWQRRKMAGSDESWDIVKERQLASARRFLSSLPEKMED